MQLNNIDTLARTIFGEARAEAIEGMEAIACVVMNRLAVSNRKGKYWWGNNVVDICRKPYQFSCWNKNDPNLPRIISVTKTSGTFELCLAIAERAIAGKLKDKTGGATHYYNPKIADPKWDDGEHPTATIGRHVFYRPKEVPKL